jgi:hypothetical protein
VRIDMTRETTKEQYRAIIKFVDNYMKNHPDETIGMAYWQAGRKFYKSPFTIRDICNNPNGIK